MKKIQARDIVKNIKMAEVENKKVNITFSIKKIYIDEFRKKCIKDKVSMASVIEEYIKDFINA